MIDKLRKEKKQLQDNVNKCYEDIQSAESKNNHLNNVKSKLEHTLDELEDELQKEKRIKLDLEKKKRKTEGDLCLSMETIAEKEKEKNVLSQSLSRKEKEFVHLSSKLENEQSLVNKAFVRIRKLRQLTN